jgi:hypothetical protein
LKKFENFDKKFKKRARARSLERVPVSLLSQASPKKSKKLQKSF